MCSQKRNIEINSTPDMEEIRSLYKRAKVWWTPENLFEEYIVYRAIHYQVRNRNGRLIAMGVLDYHSSLKKIVCLCVDKRYQRQGIGKALVKTLLKDGAQLLDAEKDKVKFYVGFGFKVAYTFDFPIGTRIYRMILRK